MLEIKSYKFNDSLKEKLALEEKGTNWPVVYLLNNGKEIYIGESSNARQRMSSHLKNEERQRLKNAHIIFDETYNKSAILDIESLLIQYMGADRKYKLQNKNSGQSRNHNYYQREKYINSFKVLWRKLQDKHLAKHSMEFIENSDLFKFSPYKNLTDEQYAISEDILEKIDQSIYTEQGYSFVINGSAGTGKSVLAVYLIKRIVDLVNNDFDDSDLDESEKISYSNLKKCTDLKIGLVIAMTSFRKTMKKVFRDIPGLSASMVLSPHDVIKDEYDILLVDESHRLMQRKNLTNYKSYDDINKQLNLDDGNQLDWVRKCSKYQILFYDSKQSVKPSDVNKEAFDMVLDNENTFKYYLNTQMRSNAGTAFIDYIDQVLSDTPPKQNQSFNSDNFEIKLFNDVESMRATIKEKDMKYGLCRMVAGYAWDWNSKGNSLTDAIDKGLYDIEIEGYKYIWNTTNKDWVNSENAIDEIGCIHTIQGYDLNYVGVIIGKDLIYRDGKLIIDKNNYFDKNGKRSIENDEELKNYIINIYKVLITRGIRGIYIYVCDDELREYLEKYL